MYYVYRRPRDIRSLLRWIGSKIGLSPVPAIAVESRVYRSVLVSSRVARTLEIQSTITRTLEVQSKL